MFRAKHIEIGKIGEDAARAFVRKLGYAIITTNFRRPWGEIDIIGKNRAGKVVFFEVKTMRQNDSLDKPENKISPEDNMSRAKMAKLGKTCQYFANLYPELIFEKEGWQIDLITVEIETTSPLTENRENCIIRHYPNVSYFV